MVDSLCPGWFPASGGLYAPLSDLVLLLMRTLIGSNFVGSPAAGGGVTVFSPATSVARGSAFSTTEVTEPSISTLLDFGLIEWLYLLYIVVSNC